MNQGINRILTTHTGSLPRPPELLPLLLRPSKSAEDEATVRAQITMAVNDAVARQVDAGIDIVTDGEMSKPGFAHYAAARLTGFDAVAAPRPFTPQDLIDYPEVAARLFPEAPDRPPLPTNDGPIAYIGQAALQSDLDTLSAALERHLGTTAFLPAISPGSVAMLLGTTFFPTRRDFLLALADALAVEYRTIVAHGFVLQVDCPDLAMERHVEFADRTIAEFREIVALHVEALNRALVGIDPDRVRIHVCWGNYPGPHNHDVPLRDILDLIYQINANGLSLEGANPRHQHEWTVFTEQPLPPGKVLIPGVIDTCTNSIEHPEVVAQRIVRYADVVGRDNVIAGTDCGFSTFAGRSAVVPSVAYAKLASLTAGARLASARLW